MSELWVYDRAVVAGLGEQAFVAYGADSDLDAAVDQARDISYTLFGERSETGSLARLDDSSPGAVEETPLPIGVALRRARQHLARTDELAAWRVAGKVKRRKVVVRTAELDLPLPNGTAPGPLYTLDAELEAWLAGQVPLADNETIETVDVLAFTVRFALVQERRKGPGVRTMAVIAGDRIIARDLAPGEAAKAAKAFTAATTLPCHVVAVVTRADGPQLTVTAERKRLSGRFKVTIADLSTVAKPAGWLLAGRAPQPS